MPRRDLFAFIVFALVSIFMFAFLFSPLAESVRGAFFTPRGRPTLGYFTLLARSPPYIDGFVNALAVAAGSTLLSSAMGVGIALCIDRWNFRGKSVLSALVPLPLIVPPFVGALGIKQLLGQTGALNALLVRLDLVDAMHPVDWLRRGRIWAVIILTGVHLYPIVYFNVSAALSSLSPAMEEAAENLGCSGVRKLTRITLPLIMPGLFSALTIVFIAGLTELGVPLICDFTEITSVQIFSGLKEVGRNPFVYALVVVLLFVTVSLYTGARLAFGPKAHALASKGSSRRTSKNLEAWQGFTLSVILSAIVFLTALPNLAVVLLATSGSWYGTVLPSSFTLTHFRAALGHDLVLPSIANSLRYVAFSTTLDIAVGVSIAYVVVRGRFRGRQLLDAAAMLPLAVPGLVLAFGYLAISRDGRPFAFLNPARDPTLLLVVAYAMRRLPFVVRAAVAGLQQISLALEEAAQSLGAGAFRAFVRVTLPLLGPHLLAGGVFAFALSMLEVSDSLVLAQKQATFPITKAMFELFQMLGEGRWLAAALGVWAMFFLGATVALARSLLGRRFGGIFRV